MFHPALDRPSKALDETAKKTAELCRLKEFKTLDKDTALALLLLADHNSHDYSRAAGGRKGVKRSALCRRRAEETKSVLADSCGVGKAGPRLRAVEAGAALV